MTRIVAPQKPAHAKYVHTHRQTDTRTHTHTHTHTNLDRVVEGARHQKAAVGGLKLDRGDEVVVCGEGIEILPMPHIPDLDLIVLRSRGDVVTVCENTCVNVCVCTRA